MKRYVVSTCFIAYAVVLFIVPQTAVPLTGLNPADLIGYYFDISLTISFDGFYDDSLADHGSDTFRFCSQQVVQQINEAFGGCPGFNSKRTTTLGFFSGSIIANVSTGYNATYVLESIDKPAAIIEYIRNSTIPLLSNATLNVNGTISRANYTYLTTQTTSEVTLAASQFSSYLRQYLCNTSNDSSLCTECISCSLHASNESLNIQCGLSCTVPVSANASCGVTNGSSSSTSGCYPLTTPSPPHNSTNLTASADSSKKAPTVTALPVWLFTSSAGDANTTIAINRTVYTSTTSSNDVDTTTTGYSLRMTSIPVVNMTSGYTLLTTSIPLHNTTAAGFTTTNSSRDITMANSTANSINITSSLPINITSNITSMMTTHGMEPFTTSNPLTTTTTPKTSTVTTQAITTPSGAVSVDLLDTYFSMFLTVSYDIPFDEDLNVPSSETYIKCSTRVRAEINAAFTGCPGFSPSKTSVLGFFSGSTVANISLGYNATYVLQSSHSSVAINEYILNYALPRLSNATLIVNGTTGRVNSTYLTSQTASEVNYTTAQFLSYEENPCSAENWCSVCSLCGFQSFEGYLENIYCYPLCQGPAYTCYITDITLTTSATCGCSQNYLLMAGTCVDQNIIIGVFAGVGGALLVGLLFALIWARCELERKRDSRLEESGDSGPKSPSTRHGDGTKSHSSGASLHVKSDLTENPSRFNPTIIPLTEMDVSSTIGLQAYRDTTDSISCVSSRCSVEAADMPPQQISQDNIPKRLLETDVYRDFRPQLQNVHDYNPIAITRPKLVDERGTSEHQLKRVQLVGGRSSPAVDQGSLNEDEKYF